MGGRLGGAQEVWGGRGRLNGLFRALCPWATHVHTCTIYGVDLPRNTTRLWPRRPRRAWFLFRETQGPVCPFPPSEHLCLDISGAPRAPSARLEECGDWPGPPSRAGLQEHGGVEATSLLRAGLRSRRGLISWSKPALAGMASRTGGTGFLSQDRNGRRVPEKEAGGGATLGDRPCTRDLGAAGLWLPVRGRGHICA